MVNLYGSGFIGNHYSKLYPCIVNDRNDLIPKHSNILYFISTTDNYNVYTNPYIDIETNLTTLIRVLEKCKDQKDTVFNFISSWFVYGDAESDAKENTTCNPKGFYSITKRAAEQLLISYCETFNIKYRILRLANILGPGDKKVSKKKNALTFLISEAKAGNPINLYDGGQFYRDYMHVKDACKAINTVISSGSFNQVYNVGTGSPVLFKDAIDYIINKTGSTSKVSSIEQADFHKIVQVKSFFMNCDKLKNLGFTPQYSIYDILDEIV